MIERLWHKAWWALHYGGRGGPTVLAHLRLRHGALGSEGEAGEAAAMEFLGRLRPQSACYAGGIDLELRSTSCCGRPTAISPRVSAPSR